MSSVDDDIRSISRLSLVPAILEVVAHSTGLRFAAVARVTDLSWTACAVYDRIDFGLQPGDELKLETTLCNEIRQRGKPIVFGHASQHPHFSSHQTPKIYGFESYISVPIFRDDGRLFGTLCALDPRPAQLDDPHIVKSLELFAALIASGLESEDRLTRSAAMLADAQDKATLREQFVAVLGHDLRTPLQSIAMAMQVLEKTLTEPAQLSVVKIVNRSCKRISGLIENTLDFARAKLGGGIQVSLQPDNDLAAELQQVVLEIQIAHSDRRINVTIDLPRRTTCDNPRIAQLLSNLLSNAIVHGDPAVPVDVVARNDDAFIEISVTNGGSTIPEDILPKLFEPFTRSPDGSPQAGLGLGLYIASEIARSHRGTLDVTSSADGTTCFTFRMPR